MKNSAPTTASVPDHASASRRRMLVLLACGLAGTALTRGAQARVYTGYIDGVAQAGHDAVAYHRQGVAVSGDPAITLVHEGALWRFSSEENRAAFAVDPTAYEPQYGGHCAWAMAQGYLAQGDPQIWRILEGRLFLNATEAVNRRWLRDLPGFIAQADANWPGLR